MPRRDEGRMSREQALIVEAEVLKELEKFELLHALKLFQRSRRILTAAEVGEGTSPAYDRLLDCLRQAVGHGRPYEFKVAFGNTMAHLTKGQQQRQQSPSRQQHEVQQVSAR